MAKRGRPRTVYHKDYATVAVDILSSGGTLADVAKQIGVALTVIKRWMDEIEEFQAAVEYGRGLALGRVLRAVFRRATEGYRVMKVNYEFVRDADGKVMVDETGEPVRVPTTAVVEQHPADPNAAVKFVRIYADLYGSVEKAGVDADVDIEQAAALAEQLDNLEKLEAEWEQEMRQLIRQMAKVGAKRKAGGEDSKGE